MADSNESIADVLAEMRADEIETEDGVVRLDDYADRIEAAEMREREQNRKLYSEIIARLEDKLAEFVRENDLLRAENEKRKNDLLKANQKIERLSGNIASELKSALIEIIDRANREKARDYDAALNGGILEIHDIANTAINQIKGE